MALTGLQIFKHLPGGKKEKEANCKKCGFPTCMAFAMKLAKGEVSSDACEFISEELKSMLESAAVKQQAEIVFGPIGNQVVVGNETVMFRHEKKFVNPTCIAIKLLSNDPEFNAKVAEIAEYSVERVGEVFKVNAVAIEDVDDSFCEKVKTVSAYNLPMILVSSSVINIEKALNDVADQKPLICLKNAESSIVAEVATRYGVPVVVSATSLESLVESSSSLLNSKASSLVLSMKGQTASELLQSMNIIRKSAIFEKFQPLGFPILSFVDEIAGIENTIESKTIWASSLICKYSNIVVLDYFDRASLLALFTLRQNIFTDPQKPLQIEPKVYEIGNPDENSPLIVTTNFALTYFSVANEVEASGVSAYILITPSDGMSVLTAWAASKFTGEIIAKSIKSNGLETMVNHRKLIIPGYVASLKIEVEEELPEWEVVVGTNEAVDIPQFLQKFKESVAVV